jgi:hypothetical protein
LDGDGDLDVVVSNDRPDQNLVYLYDRIGGPNYICINNGNGKFESEDIPFSDYPATTISSADFNKDGLMDLSVPHRNGGQSYVFI